MTVKELIERLQQFGATEEVFFDFDECYLFTIRHNQDIIIARSAY